MQSTEDTLVPLHTHAKHYSLANRLSTSASQENLLHRNSKLLNATPVTFHLPYITEESQGPMVQTQSSAHTHNKLCLLIHEMYGVQLKIL